MNDGRYVYICYYIHAPTQLVAPKAVTMAALSKCRFLRSKMIGRTGTLIFSLSLNSEEGAAISYASIIR